MMKEIDLSTWKRKGTYDCFIAYDSPIVSVTSRIDVTNLVDYCKKSGDSYFTAFTYIITRCLNEVEDFRLRIVGDKVYLLDSVDPSYIVMNNEQTIVAQQTKMTNDYKEFYKAMRSDVEIAKKRSGKDKFSDHNLTGVYYITCLPWLDFTTIMNPYDFKDKTISSIPRLAWGKYVKEGDRFKMTVDIACHHALIDGYPISQGFIKIQNAIDNIEQFLGVRK